MKIRQVLLARRPRGEFREEDFRIVDAPFPHQTMARPWYATAFFRSIHTCA
jgi:hypothetical protein